MASIQKLAKGYRAQIKLKGVRDSAVFPTRREAVEWAAQRESEIREKATKSPGDLHTLREALRKYVEEVTPTKRGARWEEVRLAAFENYTLPLDLPLSKVNATHVAAFRDARAKKIAPASVIRELTLLSSVFEVARLEWRWVDHNPCRDVRKPSKPAHRDRVINPPEVRKMLRAMGYHPREPVRSVSQAVGACMMMALRTGMRAGELCGLQWSQVSAKHVSLPLTKNGTARDVPLSAKAVRVLEKLRGWDEEFVFGIKTATLDALFRKYRGRAGLDGFTFHDTRHTAATMIAKKVDVLTLCKIFGWKDPRYALVYYNPSASSIADLL